MQQNLLNCVRSARRAHANIPSFYSAIHTEEARLCAIFQELLFNRVNDTSIVVLGELMCEI